MISKKISVIFALFLLTFSSACVETVVIGTAAGTTVALREKSVEDTKSDVIMSTKLGMEFIKNGLKNPGNSVDITINEGRILLTGIVRDPKKGVLASELAWKSEGVKEVIDEIQVSQEASLHMKDIPIAFKDYALTIRIETALLMGREISSVNYKVTTVAGVVYLIGVASDESELQKSLSLISKIRGVKKIVNYVILANDSRRR